MGFRFQKRVKLLPGIHLNISKTGVSTSFGPRGAKLTVGNGKTRTTFGIPGSGLSHTTAHSAKQPRTKSASGEGILIVIALILIFMLFKGVFS